MAYTKIFQHCRVTPSLFQRLVLSGRILTIYSGCCVRVVFCGDATWWSDGGGAGGGAVSCPVWVQHTLSPVPHSEHCVMLQHVLLVQTGL